MARIFPRAPIDPVSAGSGTFGEFHRSDINHSSRLPRLPRFQTFFVLREKVQREREADFPTKCFEALATPATLATHRKFLTMTIKVYPTIYNGTRFRSRNEARWALFFDLIEEPWSYEPRRFNLRHGSYLPDFHLPKAYAGRGMWIECKPTYPTNEEAWLAADLSVATRQHVAVVWGPMRALADESLVTTDRRTGYGCAGTRVYSCSYCVEGVFNEEYGCFACDNDLPCFGWAEVDDVTYIPCRCPVCSTLGFEFEGRGERICHLTCSAGTTDVYLGQTFEDKLMEAAKHRFPRGPSHPDGRWKEDDEEDIPF